MEKIMSDEKKVKKVSCPECESKDVISIWMEGTAAVPEYELCECWHCDHEWNECAR